MGSLVTARLCAALTCAVAERWGVNVTQPAIGTTTSATTTTTMNKGVGGVGILINIEWGIRGQGSFSSFFTNEDIFRDSYGDTLFVTMNHDPHYLVQMNTRTHYVPLVI